MAEPVELPEAKILRLQPGDMIALTCDRLLTAMEVDQIRAKAAMAFGTNRVVVLSGMDVAIVRDESDG